MVKRGDEVFVEGRKARVIDVTLGKTPFVVFVKYEDGRTGWVTKKQAKKGVSSELKT